MVTGIYLLFTMSPCKIHAMSPGKPPTQLPKVVLEWKIKALLCESFGQVTKQH